MITFLLLQEDSYFIPSIITDFFFFALYIVTAFN